MASIRWADLASSIDRVSSRPLVGLPGLEEAVVFGLLAAIDDGRTSVMKDIVCALPLGRGRVLGLAAETREMARKTPRCVDGRDGEVETVSFAKRSQTTQVSKLR